MVLWRVQQSLVVRVMTFKLMNVYMAFRMKTIPESLSLCCD